MYGKLLTHLREQRAKQSSFFTFSKVNIKGACAKFGSPSKSLENVLPPTYLLPKYLASDISTNLTITYLHLSLTYLFNVLPIFLSICKPTIYLPIFYLHIYLQTYLSISYLAVYLQTYLSPIYLSIYKPMPIYLKTTYLPKTYLFPTYLSTYITNLPLHLLTFLHLNLAITYLSIYKPAYFLLTRKRNECEAFVCNYR